MLIPLGTNRPLRRATVVTHVLLGVTAVVFLAQMYLETAQPGEYRRLMFHLAVSRGNFQWWQLISASFLHGGWMHIIGNCLFLWVFGPNIEDRLGRFWFLVFYLAGGAAAMGAHVLTSASPAIGASGSIAALTGAYLVMFPHTMIKVFSLLFQIGLFWVAAWWFIGLSIVWDFAAQASGARTNVAHMAHLGGNLFGAGVAFGLLGLKILPREQFDLFSQARQAHRRQQIRSAARAAQANVENKVGSQRELSDAAREAQEALASARTGVGARLSAGDTTGAIAAYKSLANVYGHLPRASTLSRNNQYDIANALYAAGEYSAAAYAYEKFLEAYATDSQAPQIRLLLGRINARHLNDPIRAKALLSEAVKGLWDEDARALARRELEALG